MRTLKIADADVIPMAIQQDIARSDEARYDHRVHGLLVVASGQRCQQVAELSGEDRRTVQRWVTRFETYGLIWPAMGRVRGGRSRWAPRNRRAGAGRAMRSVEVWSASHRPKGVNKQ